MGQIGATIPEHTPAIAAKLLGIPQLSRAAVGRIAYRVAKGMSPEEASRMESRITGHGNILNFRIADTEVDSQERNHSRIVRLGLGLIMGMSPEEAEVWADNLNKGGRPRKDVDR